MPPISIIGLQGRFPGGARTPDEFFEQLLAAHCFCGSIPSNRWSTERFVTSDRAAGKTQTGRGYFLNYDYQGFDPDVFGLAPDEIAFMDPQQRLVLEVAWEALEHAGFDPARLAGKDVGVYVGGFTSDHLLSQFSAQARSALGRFSAAGSTLTMLSNRVSYALDLRGPSLTVDTACASSLSALAAAVNDLQSGACTMALAGGVNFMLRPEYPIGMSAAGLLAADGRCKSFSALADGYGRGEGCGMLVLKRLANAQADGDRVLAVIESIGTGHDGRTAGISLPNGPAQAALMRRVLETSGLDAADVGFVEAHGTGTAQGDPVEAGSIAAVYAQSGRRSALPIGSLKANIGHLEAAAGVAGVIKAVLMLQKQRIPRHLLSGRPNPAIAFESLNIQLAKDCQLPANARVAVSSFGYGGSNAHVILGPPPSLTALAAERKPDDSARMLPLSAQSPAALKNWIGHVANRVAQGVARDDLLHTVGIRRGHRTARTSVWLRPAMDSAAIANCIRDCLNDPTIERGLVERERSGGTVFVFAGMGPQWAGMGQRLWADEPEFRSALEEVNANFEPLSGFSIIDALMSPDSAANMLDCRVAQPANFTLQVGLCRLFAHYGLVPDLCLGHSAGEAAAAWAARHLTLAEAVEVCWVRSELQSRCAGQGRLVSAMATESEAQALCDAIPNLEIAARNAPNLTTLCGPAEAVERAIRMLDQRGRAHQLVVGDIAYHSAGMDAILGSLASRLSNIVPRWPQISLISTVTGKPVEGSGMDASYWQRNVRAPVQFQAALETAFALGATHFVEIAAKPVLQSAIRKTASAQSHEVFVVSALDGSGAESSSVRRALSRIYATGGKIDWSHATPPGNLVDLPSISWRRERFWHEAPTQANDRMGAPTATLMAQPGAAPRSWIADLNEDGLAFLQDHRLEGVAVLAGAASLEAAIQAACANTRGESEPFAPVSLSDVQFTNPFTLDRKKGQVLDSRIMSSRLETLAYEPVNPDHAVTVMRAEIDSPGAIPPTEGIAALAARAPHPVNVERHQSRLSMIGLDHGQAFRTLRRVSLAPDGMAVLAELSNAPPASKRAVFFLHPCLMDGVFQAALALTNNTQPLVPVSVGKCDLFAPLPARIWAFLQLRNGSGNALRFDAHLYDDHGICLAHLSDIRVKPLHPEPKPAVLPDQCLVTHWFPAPIRESGHALHRVRIVAEAEDDHAARLHKSLMMLGVTVVEDASAESTVLLLQPACDLATCMTAILSQIASSGHSRLYLVTQSGQALPEDQSGVDPTHAAIWGFGRTLYNELPACDATLIDTEGGTLWHDAVAREVSANTSSSEVVLRGVERFLPHLRPVDLALKTAACPRFRSDASYLITGGLGGFGRQLALWLARYGAGHVVLTTRTQPPEADIVPLLRGLKACGARARIETLDLTDGNAVQNLVRRLDGSDAPLAGIFHWAGQTLDKPVTKFTDSDLRQVLQPKVTGGHHLHVASLGSSLDHFVLASSLSAVVGNPRQGNYVAANAWLDGLAWARTQANLPALSINFGAISGAGMAADPHVGAYLRAAGLPSMTTEEALAGLGRALACGHPQISMARTIDAIRWVRYDPRCAGTDKMADLLDDARGALGANAEIRSTMVACPPAGRPRVVSEHLRKRLAEILKCPISRLSLDQALSRQGLDSFAAVELQLAIDREFAVAVPVVSLVGGQCLDDVGRHIAEALTIEE